MRIAVRVFRTQTDFLQQLPYSCVGSCSLHEFMNRQAFAYDCADRHPWIERRHWILEDDLHLTPQRSQVSAIEAAHVFAFEVDFPGRGLQQTENGASRCRLATA